MQRRELLQVGFSSLLGLSWPALPAQRVRAASAPPPQRASGKSVILVFLTGGPSHLDTFDPKPEAPEAIRGEFECIDTSVPGIHLCEHLPQLAARMGHLAIVRAMAHPEHNHLLATHRVLTGWPTPKQPGASDLDRVATRQDFPCYAAVVDLLRSRHDGLPNGVTLPTHLVEGPLTWPGQNAGFLGARHDPWQITDNPDNPDFKVHSLSLPPGLSLERLTDRQQLLEQVNQQRGRVAAMAEAREFTGQQQTAFSLLTSGKVAEAFDIHGESEETRQRYGRHLFGQSLLLARRLVEAGVPIVQANMGIVQTWDTHSENFPKLRGRLLPALDQAVSALLDDLASRGLLDQTLLVITGEFGRTPRISMLPGASLPGRDHWARVFSSAFAGAAVRGGQVIGRSDKIGAWPLTATYGPADLGATVYHVLGIDPATEIHDAQGRPLRLNGGQVIEPLWSGVPV